MIVDDLDDLAWKSCMMSSSRHGSSPISTLPATIKSHKATSQLDCRGMHASSICSIPFGLRLLSDWLRLALYSCARVLRDYHALPDLTNEPDRLGILSLEFDIE